MPDPKLLKVGDQIRILKVPECDLLQRIQEVADAVEMAGWTADTIEQIIAQCPIVKVSHFDEYDCVWYEAKIVAKDGDIEHHSLIIYNDDTWEPV